MFVKQGVAYAICSQCGHLNGLHQDTEAFCAAFYTDDEGERYGMNYSSKDSCAYFKRVKEIYQPKAEFLSESLGQVGESPESLRYADFGAGSGYFVSALVRQGIDKVFGLEVSKFQVEFGNTMMEQKLLKSHSLEQVVGLAETVEADVVSMIGVFEHLREQRRVLEALCRNPNVRFLYLSVPTFSMTVFFEMIFPDVMQRQLSQGHTHLFTSQSLDWLAKEFNMQQVAAWWFGTDMVDLFRNVAVKLEKNKETCKMVESWTTLFTPLIDAMQLEIDKRHLASEVHMLFQLKN
jgi:cyclopropane fatty-acyl-phospholipid synthase-like methyltransferase